MEIEKQIGQYLHEQRTMRHHTQAMVAKALGINQSTYANYESGSRLFPAKYVSRLSTRLNFDIDRIVELHPKIDPNFFLVDYDEEPIVIQGKGIAVAVPIDSQLRVNPVISYMATEGYNISIQESVDEYVVIKTDSYEMSLSQKELQKLNKNVTDFIEFELYKKRNQ
ncbi:MAG: helix-turn-helix transcriptional regulator [Clostridiales bacterium]|nr:helix-turn-helix transcriptional regulator [Clostridiales bacterium]